MCRNKKKKKRNDDDDDDERALIFLMVYYFWENKIDNEINYYIISNYHQKINT